MQEEATLGLRSHVANWHQLTDGINGTARTEGFRGRALLGLTGIPSLFTFCS